MKNRTLQFWKQRLQLAGLLSLFVFLVLFFAFLLAFLLAWLLNFSGFRDVVERFRIPVFSLELISLILGTILSFIFSSRPLRPVYKLIDAVEKVASGDFSVRLDVKGPDVFRHLAKSFNHMVKELDGVEILRSDFVNSFSHEFKTPIVSIRGFARLLKNPDLSEEERNEYLDIILSESERLSELSQNVLNLNRLQQQEIVRDKQNYDLTEQIRLAIALTDQKYTDKNIDYHLYSPEIYINASPELLVQVWINLLDNAIKFSPENSVLDIQIRETVDQVIVSIQDHGKGMSEEKQAKIFEKFYQGDPSRSVNGNGIGLTIVKRIVDLHGGTIEVDSHPGLGSRFTVRLPKTSETV